MHEYDAQLQTYEQVAERAHLGERLNRYVTAVVMEARGIYAADDAKAAKTFADGWWPTSADRQGSGLVATRARQPEVGVQQPGRPVEGVPRFPPGDRAARNNDGPDAAGKQGNNDANRANRKAFQAIDAVVQADKAELSAIDQQADASVDMMFCCSSASPRRGSPRVGLGLYIGTAHLSRPIKKVTETIARSPTAISMSMFPLQVETTRSATWRRRQVFKQNGLAVNRMNAQEAAMRAKSDDLQSSMSLVVTAAAAGDFSRRIDKDYDDENLNRFARNINEVLQSVDTGNTETRRVIAALAEGDLTSTMSGSFQGAFTSWQHVNQTLATLQNTMREVRETTDRQWQRQRVRSAATICQGHRATGGCP